jgi:hypothetical protein
MGQFCRKKGMLPTVRSARVNISVDAFTDIDKNTEKHLTFGHHLPFHGGNQ